MPKKIKILAFRHLVHTFSSSLVSPNELHNALEKRTTEKSTSTESEPQSRIIPLSAAWFLPNDPQHRTGLSSFLARHIPESLFFDLDSISDTTSPYPHMLPASGQDFASAMHSLGIRPTDTVVVYDTAELGIFSAPRVAWTLRVFGYPYVHVLNNFRLWVDKGLPVEEGEVKVKNERNQDRENQRHRKDLSLRNYEQYPVEEAHREMVASFEDVRDAVTSSIDDPSQVQPLILDARSRARWEGTQPEPRPGLPSGHMPYSASLPYSELLDPETKAFLPAPALRNVLEKYGVFSAPLVISTCGTGVSAAIIDTALAEAGVVNERKRLYDGSWT